MQCNAPCMQCEYGAIRRLGKSNETTEDIDTHEHVSCGKLRYACLTSRSTQANMTGAKRDRKSVRVTLTTGGSGLHELVLCGRDVVAGVGFGSGSLRNFEGRRL